jgi:ferredoxin
MVTLEVVQGSARIRVAGCDDQPLLEQLEACDLAIRSLCCVGACSTCAVRIRSGSEVVERDAYGIGCSDDPGPGRALLCVDGILTSAIEEDRDHLLVLELASGADLGLPHTALILQGLGR